ncbi:MAG: T9SS type A sorting domain-containing protein [Bacteroidia bacterium]
MVRWTNCSPRLDLTSFDKVGLSFHVAYARYAANSGFTDTLEVWASGDCGKNFQLLWKKYGNDLATTTATTASFVPLAASHWRQEWVDLTDYSDSTYVVIKFRHTTNYENNLYIDNININEIFSLDVDPSDVSGNLKVVPNPASDIAWLMYDTPMGGNVSVSMIDVNGREVYSMKDIATTGINRYELPVGNLASGIYFIRLTNEKGAIVEKLSVE